MTLVEDKVCLVGRKVHHLQGHVSKRDDFLLPMKVSRYGMELKVDIAQLL